ncbi:RNA polymerase sigma factor [Nonomuraea turcica]|uniref:RNA polymerase sigma factor n=1 Tax=Nonomuraea sp. G32 TaxID=3067274 RepID=UPI00273A8076|nr:sigma-70 family RNA polymerase sigma factor [Nonomuraea sp. G32]MDP4509906.1 sigma-70 family RNA polymerase sigma factor [Nonomuraea sp. G32]
MYARPTYEIETVLAARAGDRAAVDELVRSHLPLVYNIAGRAMNGHPDVDDVVQETMARVVTGLSGLRDPESYRSWLVAITMNQVREWRRATAATLSALDEALGLPDPGADFAAVTITRLRLSGQRRETAEAARWLDADDREVLALWWLEVAGELTRAELAAGLGANEQHAAVRVQRTKRRLESARAVVRALTGTCPELAAAAARWDGAPSDLWRKRLFRHVRECPACSAQASDLVPADRLLAGIGLVTIPAGTVIGLVELARTAAVPALKGGLLAKGKAAAGSLLAAKPVAVAAAGATVIAGGAMVVQTIRPEAPERAAPVIATSSPATAPRTTGPSAPAVSARPLSPKPTPSPPAAAYGRTVDAVDQAPPKNRPPAPLPRRRAGQVAFAGEYGHARFGGPGLTKRGHYLTITGRGYFLVRLGILYHNRVGPFPPVTWTGLKGKLFHVASGGGRRMDDEQAPGVTWMGSPQTGYVQLPSGHQQRWQNEFYYIDGSVTVHNNDAGGGNADVDFTVVPKTWEDVWADLSAKPDRARGILRYGLTRDTGDDRAPVPQYVTRKRPADPALVPQRSQVSTSR